MKVRVDVEILVRECTKLLSLNFLGKNIWVFQIFSDHSVQCWKSLYLSEITGLASFLSQESVPVAIR